MGHESSEPTVMTICVSHRGFAAVSLEDIPIGKRDLHIPMQSGGRCTLKVLTPRGMGVRDLFATISGDDDGSGGAITKVEDGVFTFDWDDRAAGFHDLTLMLRKPSWMLAQIERLRIESGSDAEDPRLLVDLRSRLRRTDLILVNGRRQPIGGSLRVIADGADLQTRAVLLLEVDLPKRRSTLFIPSETVTALRFTCPGYVPRTVTLPLSDDEIVLEAGPRVRFRLTGAPVPPNHTLVAWIESSSTGIDSRRCEFESTGRTGIVGLETPGRWRMTFALRLGGEYDHLDGVVRTFDVKGSLNLQKFEVSLSSKEIATGIRER